MRQDRPASPYPPGELQTQGQQQLGRCPGAHTLGRGREVGVGATRVLACVFPRSLLSKARNGINV